MSSLHAQAWRTLHRDDSVVQNRIERATLRRVLRFARPHRRLIAWFLVITVVDAGLVVVPPLLVQRLVDHGIGGHDATLVVWLAVGMAAAAIADAVLGFGSGWLSSLIGEGLIYDLRTKVFAHVQRQSLAFFTRTQTGALVSRLNNDVIGAQSAFTSTLSGTVSNIISVLVVGVTMLALSWQVTLLPLLLFPFLLLASRWVSSPDGGAHPRPDERQRRHGQCHDRAVQRRWRDAAEALRTARRRGRDVRRQGRHRA